ncbi:MAG: hypothetical protein PVS2B1_24490 [Candidatus Dormibacteraceae bacterium]
MYEVPTFRNSSMCEVRCPLSTGECIIHGAAPLRPPSDPRTFWSEPVNHFGSFLMTIFITDSHVFTMLTA